MKNSITSLIAGGFLLLASCKKSNASDPVHASENGTVQGRVTDTKGQPIANAKVVIENTAFYASYVYATTDANGFYTVAVPTGSWKASVQIARQYQGAEYKFDLHPDNDNPFPGTEQATRNFNWQLSGIKPGGSGYYGSYVMLYTEPGSEFYIADVELTLTPDGPLVDGTAGQAIISATTDVGGGEDGIADVPLGKYKITARNRATGKPLQIRRRNTGEYGQSLTSIFSAGFTGETTYQVVVQVK